LEVRAQIERKAG